MHVIMYIVKSLRNAACSDRVHGVVPDFEIASSWLAWNLRGSRGRIAWLGVRGQLGVSWLRRHAMLDV